MKVDQTDGVMNLAAIQRCIDNLNNIDAGDPDGYHKAVEFYKAAKRLPFLILDFPNLPFAVYKTRTHQTDNFFEQFSDIGLPPPGAVVDFGRCNIPGQPVFYCSDYRPTSYIELLEYWVAEKKGRYLYATIGKWKISHSLKALIVTSPFAEERTSAYDQSHGKVLDNFIHSQTGESRQAIILFYKFLFDRFRKPAKGDLQTYMITAAYCNLAFNQQRDPIDAIFYPSVPYEGKGVNLAIKVGYNFENNLQLELVARNDFERRDTKPEPTFSEVKLWQAKGLDYLNKKIVW